MTMRHGVYHPPVRYGRHPYPHEGPGRSPWVDVVFMLIIVVAMWALLHPEVGI